MISKTVEAESWFCGMHKFLECGIQIKGTNRFRRRPEGGLQGWLSHGSIKGMFECETVFKSLG